MFDGLWDDEDDDNDDDDELENSEPACVYVESANALDVSVSSLPGATLRFTTWDDGLHVLAASGATWREERRDWQLAFLGAALRAPLEHPARRLAATVPPDALALAAHAGTFEITALQLLRRHAEAWDLARTAPALFWLAAAHAGSVGLDDGDRGALLRLRRVELLSRCTGGEASAAALRFIEKVVPELQSDGERCVLMRAAARPEMVCVFRHVERVPISLVRAARSCPLATRRWFADAVRCAAMLPETDAEDFLWDLVAIHRDAEHVAECLELGAEASDVAFGQLRTARELRQLHDRWAADLNRRGMVTELVISLRLRPHDPFPEPLVPGSIDIEPIRTLAELFAEGEVMHHCVASYARFCASGTRTVYRVLRPQRATLCIEQRASGDLAFIQELKGVANAYVEQTTTDAVRRWMKSAESGA